MGTGAAVSFENVSKNYLLTHHNSPRRLPFVFAGRGNRDEKFTALSGITAEIQEGQVLGIIGKNGAGKSTLLKVLSGVTPPSTGRVIVRGRLLPLLELGIGFHPQLTGRENVYLNGAILGLSRKQTDAKFDQIAEFAELGQFIDEPVKRYSSGMFVRLAFSVAAHMDPDILVADEILSQGDAGFEKKCLRKIQEMSIEGRTIILVSHAIATIEALCDRVWVMREGKLAFDGPTLDGIAEYFKLYGGIQEYGRSLEDWKDRSGTGKARVINVGFYGNAGSEQTRFKMGEPVTMRMSVRFNEPIKTPEISMALLTPQRHCLFSSHLSDCKPLPDRETGIATFSISIPPLLMPGDYLVALSTWKPGEVFDQVENVLAFTVMPEPASDDFRPDGRWGNLFLRLNWAEDQVEQRTAR